MSKPVPPREKIIEALAMYKPMYRAARYLGVAYPTMQKWIRQYNIKNIEIFEARSQAHKLPWYKRLFKKGGKDE